MRKQFERKESGFNQTAKRKFCFTYNLVLNQDKSRGLACLDPQILQPTLDLDWFLLGAPEHEYPRNDVNEITISQQCVKELQKTRHRNSA